MKSNFNFILTFLFQILIGCLFATQNTERPADANTITDMAGEWVCIGYVEKIDDFTAERKIPQEMLFLKSIQLKNGGTAVWKFSNDYSCEAQWDDKTITSSLERPAAYSLKFLGGQPCLFVEWISDDVIILDRKPCYYVCTKANLPDEVNTNPVGRWKTVDFVETIEQFDPKHKSITMEPFLRGLAFLKTGTVWQIFEENRQKTQWRGNTVDYDSEYPAHFSIKRINENDYLFMEWISGDVTERGQKPKYYVLKKVGQ